MRAPGVEASASPPSVSSAFGSARDFDPDRLDLRDPVLVARLARLASYVNRHYLRLETQGFDDLPTEPVLYVGNHNGGIAGPDLSCTLGTLWQARGPEAPLYALAHDFVMRHVRSVGALLQRAGALRATPKNALRALASGAQLLVYPGGDLDAYRHARDGDRIVLGPRSGFVRVAQEANVPIVPIVAHGAHRSAYIFSEGKRIAELLRLKRWARVERFPLAFALIARADVFGISLGGMIATWLASKEPSKVARLCLASAPLRGFDFTHAGARREVSLAACFLRRRVNVEAAIVRRLLSPRFRRTEPREVERILAVVRAENTSRRLLLARALAGVLHDARAAACTIRCPTLVLRGADDVLLGPRDARDLADAIPAATFETIEGSGHDLTLEKPNEAVDRVLRFLADTRR